MSKKVIEQPVAPVRVRSLHVFSRSNLFRNRHSIRHLGHSDMTIANTANPTVTFSSRYPWTNSVVLNKTRKTVPPQATTRKAVMKQRHQRILSRYLHLFQTKIWARFRIVQLPLRLRHSRNMRLRRLLFKKYTNLSASLRTISRTSTAEDVANASLCDTVHFVLDPCVLPYPIHPFSLCCWPSWFGYSTLLVLAFLFLNCRRLFVHSLYSTHSLYSPLF